jgi:DNA-binding protein
MKFKSYYTQICAVCISIFAIFSAPSQSFAQAACPSAAFYIEGIDVSVEADTSEKARRIAGDRGLRRAWLGLRARLLLADQPSDDISMTELRDLVDYTRIGQETVLPERYIGRLDYCFDRLRTRAFFSAKSLRHAELHSGKMLVLPVLSINASPQLWRRPNLWAEAWRDELKNRDGLADMQLASTSSIERAVDVAEIIRGDSKAIAAAARIEEAERVIITVLSLNSQGDNPTLSVTANLYDREGRFKTTVYSLKDIDMAVDEVRTERHRLVKNMVGIVENTWRNANVVNTQDSGILMLNIPASSIKQWSEWTKFLEGAPPVEKLTVVQLSSKGGVVRLDMAGSLTSLNNALERHSLVLEKTDDSDIPLTLMPLTN